MSASEALGAVLCCIVAILVVTVCTRARADDAAAAREWAGIIWTQEDPPHYRWAPASGLPDGYEAFACNRDGSVCHFYAEVSEPEIWLSFLKWYAAKQRLGVRPKLSVRGFKITEQGLIRGPYSELTHEGISVR